MPQVSRSRRGATLPLAMLLVVLLAVGVAAGLSRISVERRSSGNIEAEVDAFALAQAGLARYLGTLSDVPPASVDTTITGLAGGTVAVSARRLRSEEGGLPALYVVRAYATDSHALRFDASTPPAARSVAQFAIWRPGTINVLGAWSSVTGINKDGGSGVIDGNDECGVAPPVAGVTVPATATDSGPGYDQNGGSSVPTGSPPIDNHAATPGDLVPGLTIDWGAIVNDGALEAEYNLTSTDGWPASFDDWPTIYVDNSTPLIIGPANSGRGLLAVRGDVSMNGSFSWQGVILIGGRLTSDGNQTIEGSMTTGLNVQLGMSVGTSDLGHGNKTIRYNSCYVKGAVQHQGRLIVVPNAWTDNWPSW